MEMTRRRNRFNLLKTPWSFLGSLDVPADLFMVKRFIPKSSFCAVVQALSFTRLAWLQSRYLLFEGTRLEAAWQSSFRASLN